jgi:hypothetical protein
MEEPSTIIILIDSIEDLQPGQKYANLNEIRKKLDPVQKAKNIFSQETNNSLILINHISYLRVEFD